MLEVLNQENSIDYEMYHVFFKRGALTTIHYHETEQILMVTKGKGIVCLLNENFTNTENILKPKKIIILEENDVVAIPPYVFHFHGAVLENDFSHIAFRYRYKIDTNGNKYIAENVWESDFLNNLKDMDQNQIKEISSKIDQKIRELISNVRNKMIH